MSWLGLRTTLHKLRHHSATELIRAEVDVRTVAGRLRRSDGGTTLGYYAAWVREADQRASRILMRHLPLPHPPSMHPPEPSRLRPPSPYQVIAAELRAAILAGAWAPGSTLQTVEQLGARYHVNARTAHRAIALLAGEHLVTVSCGHRAVITHTQSGHTNRNGQQPASAGGSAWNDIWIENPATTVATGYPRGRQGQHSRW